MHCASEIWYHHFLAFGTSGLVSAVQIEERMPKATREQPAFTCLRNGQPWHYVSEVSVIPVGRVVP